MYYDSKLGAYVIESHELKKYSWDFINRFQGKLILDFPSTRGLTTQNLSRFTNPNLSFHIRGGYTKERARHWNQRNQVNHNTRGGYLGQVGVSYYEDSNIYTPQEMKQIVGVMEKIEAGISPQWTDIQKVLYVYDRLREEIIYHPKYEKQTSYDIRTLRGLISKKTVCAGYALIFKEMMDRLNIPCDYVEGITNPSKDNPEYSTHAWNIVTVNGKNIPVDLTWDAGGYRQGRADSFDNFANVEQFRKKHFPSPLERIQDYSQLYGLKEKFVREVVSKFRRKKEYTQSIISVQTHDGAIVDISQVGDYKEPGTGERMFRYIVAERDGSNDHCHYKMVYAKNNLLKINHALQKGRIDKNHYVVQGIKKMFSPSNMESCLRTGSNYLGTIQPNGKGFSIVRDEQHCKKFRTNFVERIRQDGSHFLIGEALQTNVRKGNLLHYGMIAEFDAKKRHLTEYKVISDQSLLSDNRSSYVNSFLSRERIKNRYAFSGGYLGSYSPEGVICSNRSLDSYFDIKKPRDMTDKDIVKPGYVENKNSVSEISFDFLKNVAENYTVNFDSKGEYHVVERSTGKESFDDRTRKVGVFSSVWLAAAGVKWLANEPIHGINYAFNDGAHLVYDFLQNQCIQMIENTGRIHYSDLTDAKMLQEGYSAYKHSYSILNSLNRNPATRKIVHDYFNLQTGVYRNASVRNTALSDVNSELDVMLDHSGDVAVANKACNHELEAMFLDDDHTVSNINSKIA